jgi:uncharacterized membrane protein YfhO
VNDIENPAAPPLEVEWPTPNRARIKGQWRPADMVLIHMNWDKNWKAYLNNKPVPTGADGLGQMVVVPQGTGQLDLRYEPGWTTRIVSLIGLLLTALWAIYRP